MRNTDRCTQEKPVCYNPIAGNLQGRICAGAAQPDNILDAQNENHYVNAQLIDAMYSEKWKNKVLLIEGVLLPDPIPFSPLEYRITYTSVNIITKEAFNCKLIINLEYLGIINVVIFSDFK